MQIVLYTTHCPRCKILANKLSQNCIPYAECTDIQIMRSLGISTVPVLGVRKEEQNEILLTFPQAMAWVESYHETASQ